MKPIVIMGAGPAGLTAALELVRSGHKVIVLEQEAQVGGISRTIEHRGNRMDIGGHRFFSKSDWVMAWWQEILPLAPKGQEDANDAAMLRRSRLSRIFHLRKFFSYPISLNLETLKNLGAARVFSIAASYAKAVLFPIKPEKSLEDFFINRFGRKLYGTFFSDYTQKVWGVPCREISAEWGAQRVKGLSVMRVLRHALLSLLKKKDDSIAQKGTDTSLIEAFLYPKLGPGQLWEAVAQKVAEAGGQILLRHQAAGIGMQGGKVSSVRARDLESGEEHTIECAHAVSTLPLKELVPMLPAAEANIRAIAEGLVYRDFITVGVLCKKLQIDGEGKKAGQTGKAGPAIRDNWIYIQESDVHLGRVQVFNNWSPFLVENPETVWLGLEYFANEGDALWEKPEKEFIEMAVQELAKISFIAPEDVLDTCMLRVKKAYPAYFGSYGQIGEVQRFLDSIPNLHPIGRNGTHRYNNMDHSMLSAMEAVRCINDPRLDKSSVWNINAEQEYHEGK
jgi:protoporphyrinogen oxidase